MVTIFITVLTPLTSFLCFFKFYLFINLFGYTFMYLFSYSIIRLFSYSFIYLLLVFLFYGTDSPLYSFNLFYVLLQPLEPYYDLCENWGLCAYDRFTALKKVNPELKTLLSVGGNAKLMSEVSLAS